MITVLGASGFIGSHLTQELIRKNIPFSAPDKHADLSIDNLGDVIYCIGLTADFRQRPFDTVEAHVCKLNSILRYARFDSLTYLSTARLYIHNLDSVNEETPVTIDITDPFDLYNSSKLTGELLALNCGRKNVKVVRLSNVYGNDFGSENFLTSIIKDAVNNGKIVLRTTPDSAKDYISVHDVVDLLLKISITGRKTVYNVASGRNITNEQIVNEISSITGCAIEYLNNSETIRFPLINVDHIQNEFDFISGTSLIDDLVKMVEHYRKNRELRIS